MFSRSEKEMLRKLNKQIKKQIQTFEFDSYWERIGRDTEEDIRVFRLHKFGVINAAKFTGGWLVELLKSDGQFRIIDK